MCLVVWNQTLRVVDRNGALHSEKGLASEAVRRKGKKTFGHLIGEMGGGEMREAEPNLKFLED